MSLNLQIHESEEVHVGDINSDTNQLLKERNNKLDKLIFLSKKRNKFIRFHRVLIYALIIIELIKLLQHWGLI